MPNAGTAGMAWYVPWFALAGGVILFCFGVGMWHSRPAKNRWRWHSMSPEGPVINRVIALGYFAGGVLMFLLGVGLLAYPYLEAAGLTR